MFVHCSLVRPFVCAALACALAGSTVPVHAKPSHRLPRAADRDGRIVGAVPGAAKAAPDTVLIMGPVGSGAPYLGGFQGAGGQPAWNGWTSADLTYRPNRWHADTYAAVSGAYSAWCGEGFPSCGPGDPDGGYGNDYDDSLEWRGVVADPAQPCTVTVGALVNHDVEPGYDHVHLMVETAGGLLGLWQADGKADAVPVGGAHVYQPGDYVGPAGDQVVVLFRVTSDGSWSDEDCFHPSTGAMQLDDVVITLDNGAGAGHDFEDGTLGPFTLRTAPYVGDFAQIWTGLEDVDPCATNYSPQVAFIDDGLVVPGTGGSPCLNWCYGPSGWVVNHSGGLADPSYYLHNVVESPVMAWPAGLDAARLEFDVYRHEELAPDSPGMFYVWAIRSAASAAAITDAPWLDRIHVYYGGPEYIRQSFDCNDLLVPEATAVQVQLGVYELGWVYGWYGVDGTPAPYFDNVRLAASRQVGPWLAAEEWHLAQDGFPASGTFDPADPGAASVRFDMAQAGDWRYTADALVFEAKAARAGAALVEPPRLHYRLEANPVFDPHRTSGLPAAGSVVCRPAATISGVPRPDTWFADLPDSGFLFPGDILHYFFAATDAVAGEVQTATLPADTTGFGSFASPWDYDPAPYDRRFTVRALPTVQWIAGQPPTFVQPEILFWFDGRDDADWDAWRWYLYQSCVAPGHDVDIYMTQAPAQGVGNGLGAKATVDLMSGYDAMLYTAGDLSVHTLSNGDADPSPDLQLLAAWLDLGNRHFYGAGDGLATSLLGSTDGRAFLAARLGVQQVASDLRPLIGNQTAPGVRVIPGGPLGGYLDAWRLVGGCPTIRSFDAVTAAWPGVRAAEFTDPGGGAGAYPYAAVVYGEDAATGSSCLFTPYDLSRVAMDPDGPDLHRAAGTHLLTEILGIFGFSYSIECFAEVPSGPVPAHFAAAAYPNPFNPRVRIDYAVARPGRLTVTIYDLRGRLVRTLLDEQVEAAGSVDWDAIDARGARAASGVYFYEARMHGESRVGKVMLLK
ncbi:MAG: T9SS type A sorting domain-containing protein [Candidatus Krumholzibacteriia bacterium]